MLDVDTDTATRALEERKVDLVIAHIIRPVDEERMNAEILLHEPHVVVAGVKSQWVRRRRLGLADLINEPWMLPPRDSPFGSVVFEAFRADELDVPRTIVTSFFPVRSALLTTGRFLTMVPRVVLTFPTNNPALKRLPIELPITRRPLEIDYIEEPNSRPGRELFIDCAHKFAKAMAKEK